MTWERGDVALCITDTPWYSLDKSRRIEGPKKDSYSCVEGVTRDELGQESLIFIEHPDKVFGYSAYAFRKVPPLTRDERDQFLADLEYDADVLALQRMYQQ